MGFGASLGSVNVIIAVCSFGVVIACDLVRDQNNEYPWMIKIIWQKSIYHGSLISADLVVSTYNPFEELKLLPEVNLVANRFAEGGVVKCTETRNPSKYWWHRKFTKKDEDFRNFMFWGVRNPFKIDPSSKTAPFLFVPQESINSIVEDIRKIKNGQKCRVPVFDKSKTTKIEVQTVTYFADCETCKQAFCQSPRGCTRKLGFTPEDKSVVCASDETQPLDESQQGAVMICDGQPMGLLSLVGRKGKPEGKFSVFLTLAYSTDLIKYGIQIHGGSAAEEKRESTPSEWKLPQKTVRVVQKGPSKKTITYPTRRHTTRKSMNAKRVSHQENRRPPMLTQRIIKSNGARILINPLFTIVSVTASANNHLKYTLDSYFNIIH